MVRSGKTEINKHNENINLINLLFLKKLILIYCPLLE